MKGELLAGDGRLIHQAALRHGEHRHSLVVMTDRTGILLAAARTGFLTVGGGGGAGRCRDRHNLCVRPELEASGHEFVSCRLVLEENDFTVRLAAGLKADAHLRKRRLAGEAAVREHVPLTARAADNERPFADGGNDRKAIAMVEKLPLSPAWRKRSIACLTLAWSLAGTWATSTLSGAACAAVIPAVSTALAIKTRIRFFIVHAPYSDECSEVCRSAHLHRRRVIRQARCRATHRPRRGTP